MLLCFQTCYAEGDGAVLTREDVNALQHVADENGAGVDVYNTIMAIASGDEKLDFEFIKKLWAVSGASVLTGISTTVSMFMAPLVISALFVRVFPGNRYAGELICGCAASAVFIPVLIGCISWARELTVGIASVLEAAVPLLTTLSALGGGTSSAALITPAAALTGEVMAVAIGKWGIFLTGAAGVCACADALGSAFRLSGLLSLIKRVITVAAGLMLALFAGILKVQGMLGASFDSAAVKTARFAVDKIVPAVGGGIADTMDAAISSVLLIKNAVGVTGIMIIASACSAPILRISATLTGVRIAAAITQPVAETQLTSAATEFGDVIRLLVVLCATSLTLGLILIGASIGAGGGIAAAGR